MLRGLLLLHGLTKMLSVIGLLEAADILRTLINLVLG